MALRRRVSLVYWADRGPHRPATWLARALLLTGALACSLLGGVADITQYRIDQLVGGRAWSVLGWEAQYLPGGLRLIVDQALAPPTADQTDSIVARYLAGETVEPRATLALALAQVVQRELLLGGMPQLGGVVWPPVALALVEPPRSLVVSPRREIRVAQWALLNPSAGDLVFGDLERQVETLDVSALVVEIGGIATYPTLIPPDSPPTFAIETVAHEWVHTALFFTPLGRAYGVNPQAQSINETVADLVGREVAGAIRQRLGPEPNPRAASGSALRSELRRIRLEVDQLLDEGDIAGAEAFLEAERRALVDQGYAIRRLNQAYFAFYGNYADGPARSTEIPDRLRALRDRSPSVGSFLAMVGQVSDLEGLRRLTSE